MHFFQADPRDGVPSGTGCDSCCCDNLSMMVGETNLLMIDYAPWSIPIGSPGIVDGMEFNIEVNDSACPTGESDGHLPPTATNRMLATATNTVLNIDLSVNVAPVGNTFTYSIVPFSGPTKGALTQTASGTYTYTPNGGVTGKDYFSYEAKDAQGRTVTRHVEIDIGANIEPRNNARLALTPFVDPTQVVTNQGSQTVRFAIYMPFNCRPCERYKMTVKQPAQDCNCQTFHHFKCLDITCKPCG